MRTPAVILALGLATACGRESAADKQPPIAATATKPAKVEIDRSKAGSLPPIDQFRDASGRAMTVASFKGKPTLVNLWATWCGPCLVELPAFDRIAGAAKGRLQVVAINQDSPQAVDPVDPWWTKARLRNLALYRDPATNLGFAYGGGMLPTTVLYGADGREIWRVAGALDWEGAEGRALLKDFIS